MIYLSYKARPELVLFLKTIDEVTLVGPIKHVDPRLDGHGDLLYCSLNRFGESEDNAKADNKTGAGIYIGDEEQLSSSYPGDCLYNAAVVGKYFIHNGKITDPGLLAFAKEQIPGLQYIDVKQGYTKCNVAVLDHNHIITSDRGIAKAVKDCGAEIELLLINSGGIKLMGFDNGFLGGTCGRIKDYLVFNGDISAHSDYNRISSFAADCGLRIKAFPWELEDIGSIIRA